MQDGQNLLKWIPFSAALLFSCSILIWLSIFRPQLFGPNISGMAIVVVYIALIFAWTFISPAASVCFSSKPLFQACATILPAELLLALTLFWEHRLVGLLVAACWLAGSCFGTSADMNFNSYDSAVSGAGSG